MVKLDGIVVVIFDEFPGALADHAARKRRRMPVIVRVMPIK
jgi:hypothetical protein